MVSRRSTRDGVPAPTNPLFQKIRRTLLFLWSFVRILWYWFERIFLLAFILLLTAGLAWWLSQKPSLYRDWETQDARIPEISWS